MAFSMNNKGLSVVDDGGFPEYPISADDRLDSHYFVQWNLRRWSGSDFRKEAHKDPEVGFFGLELFFLSHSETPIGTLPCDDEKLAFLLHLSLEKWRSLRSRKLNPLHNWHKVMCDNGEVRLAHPVVTLIASEALGSKKRNAAKNADDRMRKRLGTIAHALKANIPGGARAAGNDEFVNRLSDWIEEAYPGGSATAKRVKEAWEAVSKGL